MEPFTIPDDACRRRLETLVQQALAEDIGPGDLTTEALELRQDGHGYLVAKSPGVLSGVDAFEQTFRALDPQAGFRWSVHDGEHFAADSRIVTVRARADALLSGERTAVNFLARLSGIATLTRRFVDLIPAGQATRLLDTRKTTPGWRLLEKKAARAGGAVNHRLGLYDAFMIKENHVAAVGDFSDTLRRTLAHRGPKPLICETRNITEVRTALASGVRWLLLDHFPIPVLKETIAEIRRLENGRAGIEAGHVIVEVSGNVTEVTLPEIAACGPDYISVGCITHSAPAVDFSMLWAEG